MRYVSGLVLLLAVVACGQVEPVLMALSMPDCTYSGPDSMDEGRARLSLTLNGIGEWGAALVVFEDDHEFSELELVAEESPLLADLPEWVRVVVELRLSDDGGREGTDAERVLEAGEHAVLCIYPDDDDDTTYRPAHGIRVDER